MRIVSLLPAATDIVAALGAGDLLVGRTHECDWPAELVRGVPVVTATDLPEGLSSRGISAAIAAGSVAHHGSSIYRLDRAALADLRPDLILTQDLCERCAVSYRSVNEAVRALELDVTVLSLEPRTIGGILTAIDTVAARIGAEKRAVQLREDAARRLAALPGRGSAAPRVLFVEWLDPPMPGGHWVPEQITLAGGVPVFLGPGAHSVPFRPEELAAADPEVVIFGPCGFTPERTLAEIGLAAGWPGWSGLSAVRDGRVWVVDGPAYFNRPGPRVVDGAEILAGILADAGHPEAIRVSAGS